MPRIRARVLFDDDSTADVVITQADMLRFDEVRPTKGWLTAADVLPLYNAFLAWSALERAGEKPGRFDDWKRHVDDVELGAVEPVDPTRPAPGDGSSSSLP